MTSHSDSPISTPPNACAHTRVAVLVIIWQVIVFLRSLRKTPLPMLAGVVPATE